MTSVLLFLFMLVTCLMFLGMLWGDRLSFPGLFEGNWLNPVVGLVDFIARSFGEFLDVTVEFVVGHLSWVVAAVSGTAGLILVAFLIGGGLADDAEAFHLDSVAPLAAGGVVDRINKVEPAEPTQDIAGGILLTKADVDDSHYLDQAKGGGYLVFRRPEYQPPRILRRRPIEGSLAAAPADQPLLERPDLDVHFHRLASETLPQDRGHVKRTGGRLLNDLPDVQFVDRAVRKLLRDNWRAGFGLHEGSGGIGRADRLTLESPLASVTDLESQIRVTPGMLVSRQDLRIEKHVPQRSPTGEVTIQIAITNLSRNSIDGLLIRELLPYGTRVRGAVPEGILHDATLTWLMNNLQPQQERVLHFTLLPADNPRGRQDTLFQTQTEVSALTAVQSRTVVTGDRLSTAPPIRTQPPTTIRAPRLRLQIAEPRPAATIGTWTMVRFRITNIGDADADNVQLRVILDEMLDHHALRDDDPERQVDAPIARIAPDDYREFELMVKPRRTGVAESTAELRFAGQQLDIRSLRFSVGTGSSSLSVPPPIQP